jgi:hypothetical protein
MLTHERIAGRWLTGALAVITTAGLAYHALTHAGLRFNADQSSGDPCAGCYPPGTVNGETT